jgi:hypothetical protein
MPTALPLRQSIHKPLLRWKLLALEAALVHCGQGAGSEAQRRDSPLATLGAAWRTLSPTVRQWSWATHTSLRNRCAPLTPRNGNNTCQS